MKPDAGRPGEADRLSIRPGGRRVCLGNPFAAVARLDPPSWWTSSDPATPKEKHEFSGREDFAGRTDKLVYRPRLGGERLKRLRKETARLLQLGLLRFFASHTAAGRLDVLFEDADGGGRSPGTFRSSAERQWGFSTAKSPPRFQSRFGALAANRVTPEEDPGLDRFQPR